MSEPKTLPEIKEVRIKRVRDLSPVAQQQVHEKLNRLQAENPSFQFKGFAKVRYVENSPLSVYDIEPIEGDASSYFAGIMDKVRAELKDKA